MARVFIDTAAWIALLNSSDALHSPAQKVMADLRRSGARMITTEFVLLEVADALSAPHVRSRTVTFLDGLRRVRNLEILPASQQLLLDGWSLYSRRPDKDWGLTDCISFDVMLKEGITDAFTSDRHFEQAGFAKLL